MSKKLFLAIRGVVTLFNRLNYPADFTWNAIVDEKGTAFSMRPAEGDNLIINWLKYSSLVCVAKLS